MLWSGNARLGGKMKKILIILIFLFISIFSYSADIDFNIRVMMGLTKIEETNNPKYKKFLNYIDENLVKKVKLNIHIK